MYEKSWELQGSENLFSDKINDGRRQASQHACVQMAEEKLNKQVLRDPGTKTIGEIPIFIRIL